MKTRQSESYKKRARRHLRIRSKVKGTAERPRLSVFRSNKHLYAQLIDDDKGVTLVSVSANKADEKKDGKSSNIGKLVAEKAKVKKISKVVFDRGGFLFKGKIKELAEGARRGGLIF